MADEMRISDWSSYVCSSDLGAGSIPVSRSIAALPLIFTRHAHIYIAHVAQSVEHLLGKEEVDGSIPFVSTTSSSRPARSNVPSNTQNPVIQQFSEKNSHGQGYVRANQTPREVGNERTHAPR